MILRLPHRETRWVWEIDQPRARMLIKVVSCRFNGEEWWVTTRTLPMAPTPMLSALTLAEDHHNELDRFWEAATPVGGRIEDLSNPISQEQYDGKRRNP